MYKNILLPLDGSKRAEAIVAHVENMAMHYNAKVCLLRVDDPPLMLGYDEVIDEPSYRKQREQHKKELEMYLASIREKLEEKGIQTRVLIAAGPVVKTILNIAKEEKIDLIAMASHGIDLSYQRLFGSVAIGLLENTTLPLLLLRNT